MELWKETAHLVRFGNVEEGKCSAYEMTPVFYAPERPTTH